MTTVEVESAELTKIFIKLTEDVFETIKKHALQFHLDNGDSEHARGRRK